MLRSIIILLRLLSPAQQKRLFILQILVMLMAFAEVVGVTSIGPFMALIGDATILSENNLLSQLYEFSGLTKPEDFIFWLGTSVLILLALGTLVSMLTFWRLSLFAQETGMEIGNRLFNYYMYQPWLFHASESSAKLIKQIATETSRVTSGVISPLMQLNARLIMAIFMSIAIYVYNPTVMISALAIFGFAYLVLYNLVKDKLTKLGQNISIGNWQRFKLMSEGFGGIKDVLLLGRQKGFTEPFESNGRTLSYSVATDLTLIQVPRYFMELVAYGAVILLILYLNESSNSNLSSVLPILAIYSMAGLKLLPVFQTTYGCIASIRGNLPAFEAIKKDLEANQSNIERQESRRQTQEHVTVNQCIKLENIEFFYPGKKIPALAQFNIEIPIGKVIGLVGLSGAGKSTAIDILLGLINPDKGQLLIDGRPLKSTQTRAWQNIMGFVPQSIFLSDATIMENIAFGFPASEINRERVLQVVKLAHLEDFIEELPDGLNTIVGERGVQLSGGQRQRIGIARALYCDVKVLVLDEATSALDGITEKQVMDAIYDFSGRKTIVIIAHRITTVQKCDIIYLMEQGKVVDHGKYSDLVERNETFRQMAMNVKSTI
jgi:ATP-binding cassette, subfamily B, bacterial PglK